MFQSIISVFVLLTFVSTLPTNKDIETEENVINVDEKPAKVEQDLTNIPLGSQFAVEYFFPERKNLETGHRIPLELFPIETQNKILEVEPVSETVPVEKYVDSSSFRFSPSRAQAAEESLRNLFGAQREGDRIYEETLSVFAPPSFFS